MKENNKNLPRFLGYNFLIYMNLLPQFCDEIFQKNVISDNADQANPIL